MADQVGHDVEMIAMTRPTVIAGLTGNLKCSAMTMEGRRGQMADQVGHDGRGLNMTEEGRRGQMADQVGHDGRGLNMTEEGRRGQMADQVGHDEKQASDRYLL